MCGIAGYFAPGRPFASPETLRGMLHAIRHRGPDGAGLAAIDSRTRAWRDLAADDAEPFAHDVGFAHCRFAIVDPGPAGHQPFWSEDRSLVVSTNGEIYNHLELRDDLEKLGHRFRSACDTEVLLAAYAEWGLECFDRLNGFWAASLYDLRRRRLILTRDRVGKSPLYYAVHRGVLYWASEIKALHAACGRDAFAIDEQAIFDFVQRGWRDVGHRTFYRGVRTLDNASWAVVGDDLSVRPEAFWRLPDERASERELPFEDASRAFLRILDDAVRLRERADVPLAMELSGGLDSSSLVALRASRANEPFAAYSISFDAPEADELPYAKAVAARYPREIEHRVIRPPLLEFWDRADAFVQLVEEPFHSPNVLTNHMLRHAIRADGFKVVVVGSGGDELLAGYPEYGNLFLADLLRRGRLGAAARELASSRDRRRLLRGLLTRSRGPAPPPAAPSLLPIEDRRQTFPHADFDGRMRDNWGTWKLAHWLRIGNKVQYGIPIEPRAPFMDHRLVELAFRLPSTYLIRQGYPKYILRMAMRGLLPGEVAWRRRKMGFPFPLRDWLRASKGAILRNARGAGPECLHPDALPEQYDALAESHPQWLWRYASVLLWDRRCHRGESIRV